MIYAIIQEGNVSERTIGRDKTTFPRPIAIVVTSQNGDLYAHFDIVVSSSRLYLVYFTTAIHLVCVLNYVFFRMSHCFFVFRWTKAVVCCFILSSTPVAPFRLEELGPSALQTTM